MFDNIKENISNISPNTTLSSLTLTENIKEQKKCTKKNKKKTKNLMLNYKHKLRPTNKQINILNQYIFAANQVYNITISLLDKQRLQYNAYKNLVNKSEEFLGEKISKRINFKNFNDTVLDQKIKQILKRRKIYCPLDVLQGERSIAKKAFFDGFKEKGFASYRKSSDQNGAFCWTNARTKLTEKYVNIDQKLKDIRINRERLFPQDTQLKQVRLKKVNNKFHAVFTIEFLNMPENNIQEFYKNKNIKSEKDLDKLNILSMDTNNGHLDFNDKSVMKYPRNLTENELMIKIKNRIESINKRSKTAKQKQSDKLLKEFQKSLKLEIKQSKRKEICKSKKIKYGKNYQKDKLKLSKLKEKQSNRRKNLLDKVSNDILSKTFDVLIVENLKVKKMTEKLSEKEFKKTNKSKIMSKKNDKSMRKNILNFSYSTLHNMLSYKAMHIERFVVKINPKNTSKMCSSCGYLNKITLKTRNYCCEKCGLKIDRDYNSSLNIENLGQKYLFTELNSVCLAS